MPVRRRVNFDGYGSADPPRGQEHGRLLPPPSGKPPVRLPINAVASPQPQQQAAPMPPEESNDPNAMLIRLLQSAGKL